MPLGNVRMHIVLNLTVISVEGDMMRRARFGPEDRSPFCRDTPITSLGRRGPQGGADAKARRLFSLVLSIAKG